MTLTVIVAATTLPSAAAGTPDQSPESTKMMARKYKTFQVGAPALNGRAAQVIANCKIKSHLPHLSAGILRKSGKKRMISKTTISCTRPDGEPEIDIPIRNQGTLGRSRSLRVSTMKQHKTSNYVQYVRTNGKPVTWWVPATGGFKGHKKRIYYRLSSYALVMPPYVTFFSKAHAGPCARFKKGDKTHKVAQCRK